MTTRTTLAAAGAVLALALTGCGSSTNDKPDQPAPTSASPTPTATVDQAALERACVDAWRAMFEKRDSRADNTDNPPAGCTELPVEDRERLWLVASKAYLEANRECTTDPSCTRLPRP